MSMKVRVKLDEIEKLMAEKVKSRPEKNLANLPEDFGLWLYWRRLIGERVPNDVAGSLRTGVTTAMVNNFFTEWYGIGKGDFASFEEMYKHLRTKEGKQYKDQKCPPRQEIEQMIETCENEYGDKVPRSSTRRSRK